MTINRSFSVTKDVFVIDAGSGAGNGLGNRLYVGPLSGNPTRTILEFQPDYSSGRSVPQADLRLAVKDAPGNRIVFYVEEVTEGFQEGSYGKGTTASWSTSNTTAAAGGIWPGPAHTASRRVRYDEADEPSGNKPTVGRRIRVNITAIVANHFRTNRGKPLRLRLVAADPSVAGYNEGNAARSVAFESQEGDGPDGPLLDIVLEDNRPPRAPNVLSPLTRADVGDIPGGPALVNGLSLRVRFQSRDPDAGDYLTGSEVQVFTEDAQDDDNGNITTGTRLTTGLVGLGAKTSYTGTPTEGEHVITGFAPGARIRYRLRTRDRRNAWGLDTLPVDPTEDDVLGWTRLEDGWVDLNSAPLAPTSLAGDTTNPSPSFSGDHRDPDAGSSLSGVETQVRVEGGSTIELLENATDFQAGDEVFDTTPYSTRNGTGMQRVAGGTRWTVPWDGTRPLTVGERVSRRHRTRDQFGRAGAWSDWITWTVGQATSPTAIPAPGVRQLTTNPTVGASHSSEFDRLAMRAWSAQAGGTLLMDATGVNEVAVPVPTTSYSLPWADIPAATPLQWGQVVYIERSVRTTEAGVYSPWSPREPMPINALPLAPLVLIGGAVRRSDGVWVVPSRTPRLTVTFNDPDAGDTATKREVVIRSGSSTGLVLLSAVETTDPTGPYDVATGLLGWEATYHIATRMADDSGEWGGTTSFLLFVHQPPDVTAGPDPDDADPTPTLTWSAVSHGTAIIARSEVVLEAETDVADAWDPIHEGSREDAIGSYTIPAGTLSDAQHVRAFVTVYDSMGVGTVLAPVTILLGVANGVAGAGVATVAGTVLTPVPSDAFTRSTSDAWGTATAGGAWTVDSPAADYDTSGTEGTLVVSTVGVSRLPYLGSVALRDITATIKLKTSKLAVGGKQRVGIVLRRVDASNYYLLDLEFRTDQTVYARIVRVSAGVATTLANVLTILTHGASTYYWIKAKALGDGTTTTLQLRAWADGNSEPVAWHATATDTTAALQGALPIGLRVFTEGGTTNAPITVTFDGLSTTTP